MTKLSRKTNVSKSKLPRSSLKSSIRGRVDKNDKKKQHKKVRQIQGKNDLIDGDEDNSLVIKKKPSKAELKSVIEGLKNDARLVLVRKALKYIPSFLKSEGLTKKLLKEIIKLWAEAGEKDKEIKKLVIKKLYNSFLDKCRVTKQDTMSMIGFMRHSLIELYKIDPQIAFKQAETSCQQLTLTLKNAYTHKNEETHRTVLNWQFANCLILLSNLIISHDDDSPVKSLAHQVIQLNLGAINFLTSPRYYPYYCHLLENLIGLSVSTSLFIPILPSLLAILEKLHIPKAVNPKEELEKSNGGMDRGNKGKRNAKKFAKKSKESKKSEDDVEEEVEKKEVKEYNMDTLNHVSLDEAHCPEYNIAVVNKIYELLVRYLASQCHKIAFPELMLLPSVQLKKWIKKNPDKEAQKFKVLLEKVKSDCEKLEEIRKSANFSFTDYTAVDAWEKRMKDSNKLSLFKLISDVK